MEINSDSFYVLKASEDNYDDYYSIRSEDKNLYWTGYESPPDYENFKLWFKNRIKDKDRDIFLLYKDGQCIGSLHIDYYPDYATIGYSVKQAFEGKGYGTLIVKEAIKIIKSNKSQRENLCSIKAWINAENLGSIKVAEKNNFRRNKNNKIKKRFGKEELYYEFEFII